MQRIANKLALMLIEQKSQKDLSLKMFEVFFEN